MNNILPPKKWHIVSLGGSLVVPQEVDTFFVKEFLGKLIELINLGHSFLIIVGGGYTSRSYQKALSDIAVDVGAEGLDWVGISGTRINAEMLRLATGDLAYGEVVFNPELEYPNMTDFSLVFGAGWKPGWSTDYVATRFAQKVGAREVINLSKVDHIYTADPKVNLDAKKIEQATWDDYLSFIPSDWEPGLSTPFDPVAARLAKEAGLNLSFVSNEKIDDFVKCVKGEDFLGTRIIAD